ncbi:MAG: ABC transporter [Deltaproteobacteria bacterium]|nr:ABC transporter [Deltaproteobacteria bacterium]
MSDWTWNGARWWKFDFHAHTPTSDDYGKGPTQETLKQRSSREWLLDYMKAGIDCVAVTDHNSGARIDELKTTVQQIREENHSDFRELKIFPGAEISVNGNVHVLAILDPDRKSSADIDSLLGAVGFRGTKGSGDACTEHSLRDVISEIDKAGGIAIPAHVDEPKGLFEEQHGTTLGQALDLEDIFAMEVCDSCSTKPQLYSDRKQRWTEVLGSDSHHPTGQGTQRFPGSHYTWVKMGAPSLEGLRLALLDGELSVKRSDAYPSDPNVHPPLAIESIKVRGACYMGRSRAFNVPLNPWLNAIIGGRGTGKSTIIEFLRLALRREKEIPETLAHDFEKYWKVYLDRNDGGLLTKDSSLVVTYRKDENRFRIQWNQLGDLEPIEVETRSGDWTREEGDILGRFPVRIYSQKQIFELAKTPLALLRIIDEAADLDRRSFDEAWKDEEVRFLSLRAKAREVESGLADAPRLRGELDDVKRKLSVFEESGHADVLKTYQKCRRQKRAVETWEQEWSEVSERLGQFAREIVPDPIDSNLFDEDNADEAALLEKTATARKKLAEISTRIEEQATETDRAIQQWRTDRDASTWKEAHDSAVLAYDELQKTLDAEGAGDPAAYGELVQRRQNIEGRLQAIEQRRGHLVQVRKDAESSLERLRILRRELTERRSRFLETVLKSNPFVKINVVPYGNQEAVEPEFRRLIQRDNGFDRAIGKVGKEGLLGELYRNGSDGPSVKVLDSLKGNIKKIAEDAPDAPDVPYQNQFAAHLKSLQPETYDRIDLWFPEDSLDVQYSTTGDGRGFRSIQKGSPGQRTAALLAFLLSYGSEPIVLDQPEDDLDNHLIYDLIVTQLRAIKQRRQVIVVTHNANIVVNGDAELVVALATHGGETQTECAGSMQESTVRDTICKIMEGGREAFEQRYRRIAMEDRHV